MTTAIKMSSVQILSAIDKIAATPGKNDKQSLIKTYAMFPSFVQVLKAALDPTITYGIAQVPERVEGSAPGGNTFDDAPIWQMIDDLANRRLTGNAARDEIQKWMTFLNAESAELLKRILKKDLRAGFGESTVNKVISGCIPDFPYMRCSLETDLNKKTELSTWPWAEGVVSQEKADGMFMNVNHEIGGAVILSSRAGSMFPSEPFESVANDIRAVFPEGRQQHGEMLVEVDGVIAAREIGNGILNSVLSGGDFMANQRPVFFVWDSIPLEFIKPKGKYEKGYKLRLTEIVQLMQPHALRSLRLIPTRIVKNRRQAMEHAVEMMKCNKEGTIVKHPHAIWKDGTSNQQVKQKLEFDVDLIIVGREAGNGKNAATFGSIICRTSDGLLEVAVSGFKDKPGPGVITRQEIHDNWDSYPGTIMTVRANAVMKPSEEGKLYSLFLPRFAEFRKDKTTADSLAQVLAIEEAAKQCEEMLKEAA